jgi:hypothetical protein
LQKRKWDGWFFFWGILGMLGDGRLKPFLIELVENIFTAENQCHRAEREKSTAENQGFKIGRGAQKEKKALKKVRVEATI